MHEVDTVELARLEATLPSDAPLHVLNLLRFRERALYPEGVEPAGATGREAYFEGYRTAFQAVAASLGVEGIGPAWVGTVAGVIAGGADDRWDMVSIIRYPSVAAFRRVVGSDAYKRRAEPLRRAALAEWRLIAQTETPVLR